MSRLLFAALTALALMSPAAAQQRTNNQKQVYACEAIHKRCVSRSVGSQVSMCDGYYADAKRSGVWPAFGQSPAVECRR